MDYEGQKRENNGQFGTGKKAGGGASKSASKSTSKSSSKKPVKPKAKKPKILPKEREAVHHELNTHLTKEERAKGIVEKNLFGAIYTVEIWGFDEYNITAVRKNDETRNEYLKDFRKKGKKR